LTDLTLIVQDLKIISLVLAAGAGLGQNILQSLLTTVVGLGQVLLRDLNNPSPSRDSAEG
jgi:choline dehydrogenase